jgi:hypothetical protein
VRWTNVGQSRGTAYGKGGQQDRQREQRKKLKASGKPYFETFERGLDIGYRKGQHGGVWVLRRYLGERRYATDTIGRADDEPDEVGALAYDAARGLARDRLNALAEEARFASDGPLLTVQRAIEEYIAGREAREDKDRGGKGRKADAPRGLKHDARSKLTKHVLSNEKLAAKPLATISADTLSRWLENLDLEPGTAQRVTSDFKAALNAAAKRYRDQLPPTIRDTIKDGLPAVEASTPVARVAQVPSDSDVRRVTSAAREVDDEGDWGGDLDRVVLTAAATGARSRRSSA